MKRYHFSIQDGRKPGPGDDHGEPYGPGMVIAVWADSDEQAVELANASLRDVYNVLDNGTRLQAPGVEYIAFLTNRRVISMDDVTDIDDGETPDTAAS